MFWKFSFCGPKKKAVHTALEQHIFEFFAYIRNLDGNIGANTLSSVVSGISKIIHAFLQE